MRYPKLEIKKEKSFVVDTFSRGINKSYEETPIFDCKNMVSKADAIVNRPAVEITDGRIFYKEDNSVINKSQYCDAFVFLEGKYYKVAVFSKEQAGEYVIYEIFLLDEDGKAVRMVPLKFEKQSNEVYDCPTSITVFSSNSKKGCGIFAFVSVENVFASDNNNKYKTQIFELSADASEWLLMDFLDMYIPEYYVNGRGSAYSKDIGISLPEPKYKEAINMLNNTCKCTFNTDGASVRFYMPPDLSYENNFEYFNCKLYLEDGVVLDYTVDPRIGLSNAIKYNGEDTCIRFAPGAGYVHFFNIIPPENRELRNNMVVTIRLKKPESDKTFNGVDKGIWYSSREAGGYLCLAGNSDNPSQILISGKDNPFYFPKGSGYKVGDPSQKITALARQNKSLVIFKENELYCADCVANKFSVTHLHSSIGCDLPDTIAICENRLVWANSDKKVYTLNALSDYGAVAVYGMSRSIDEDFKSQNFSGATACYSDRRYYLFLKSNVYVLDLSGALLQSNREFICAAAWFKWELPSEIEVKTAYAYNNYTNFVCGIAENGGYYMASLKGKDGIDKFLDTTCIEQERVIESSLTTGIFYNSDYANKKIFTRLFANIFAERDVAIDFIDETGANIKNTLINIKYNGKDNALSYKLLPFIRGLGLSVNIRAGGKIKLNKLTFFYKTTI